MAGVSQASPSPSLTFTQGRPGHLLALSAACVQCFGISALASETLKQFYTHTCTPSCELFAVYLFSRKKLKKYQAVRHLPRPPWIKLRFTCQSLGPDTHFDMKF